MTDELSHVAASGEARMVDVGGKPDSERVARAAGSIRMKRSTLDLIRDRGVTKGDVLSVARVAGVMAAKRTSELIPLCHPVAITDIQIAIDADDELPGFRVEATTRSVGKTGVEMEAIVAVAVTLITVYDMAKAVDKGMLIGDISLQAKSGGISGAWVR
ncbi:MAG: cyclic pyranopterin monophosphate synthase MoaC [Gemmatimonadaceae bacterium]